MPIFEYQATNSEGKPVNGTAHGTNAAAVMQSLTSKGLEVVSIAPAQMSADPVAARPREMSSSERAAQSGGIPPEIVAPGPEKVAPPTDPRSYFARDIAGPLVGQVPLKDLSFFFRQFATMQSAGVGMVDTLNTLSGQSRSGKLSGIIKEMAGHSEVGRPISVAMQRYPEVFTPLMMSLVRAGERGGMVDTVSNQLADYLDSELELRRTISRALLWPKIIIVSSIIIIIAANSIITGVAATSDARKYIYSPLTDPIVWVWLTPAIIALFLFVRIGLHNTRVKFSWDQAVACLPGFSGTARQFAMAKFGKAFGTLYKAGVSIPESIKLGADACGNEYIRARIYPAAENIKEGGSITPTLRETNIFNPIVLDMTHTGETTGNLDQMLLKMSEFYEAEGSQNANRNAVIFGVFIYGFVALYVAYIIIRFYVDYFSGVMKAA